MNFNRIFNSIPFQFLLGGTLVASITYLANNVSPKSASILVAFPIGLIPMLFLKSQNKERRMSFDTTITNSLVVVTYLILDILLTQEGNLRKYAVLLTMIAWSFLAYLLYSFGNDVGIHL